MKYLIIIVLSLFCSICYGIDYKETPPPEKPLITWHQWSFSSKEMKKILVETLVKQGITLPIGKTSIQVNNSKGAITLLIKEQVGTNYMPK